MDEKVNQLMRLSMKLSRIIDELQELEKEREIRKGKIEQEK